MEDLKKVAPTPVRLPFELKKWLKHQAVDNCRSLNGELIHRLELSRKQEKAVTQ